MDSATWSAPRPDCDLRLDRVIRCRQRQPWEPRLVHCGSEDQVLVAGRGHDAMCLTAEGVLTCASSSGTTLSVQHARWSVLTSAAPQSECGQASLRARCGCRGSLQSPLVSPSPERTLAQPSCLQRAPVDYGKAYRLRYISNPSQRPQHRPPPTAPAARPRSRTPAPPDLPPLYPGRGVPATVAMASRTPSSRRSNDACQFANAKLPQSSNSFEMCEPQRQSPTSAPSCRRRAPPFAPASGRRATTPT